MALEDYAGKVLDYEGAGHLVMKVVLSLISGHKFKLTNIRVNDGGLNDAELNFLELLNKVTNGSESHIDVTNTELTFSPGSLDGLSNGIIHECHPSKPIGWYLFPLVMLAPLMRDGLMDLKLKGASHDGKLRETSPLNLEEDGTFNPEDICNGQALSVDYFRLVVFPMMVKLDPELSGAGIEVISRGFEGANAMVKVRIPPINAVKSLELLELGRVKRIRAQSVLLDVNPAFAAGLKKVVANAMNLCPDAYTYEYKGKSALRVDKEQGKPLKGYGITVIASTIKGITRGAEYYVDEPSLPALATQIAETQKYLETMNGELGQFEEAMDWKEPEWVSFTASTRLLSELQRGGVVDTCLQGLFLLYMALGAETSISKIRLSELTPNTEMWLRHINDFLSVKFDVVNARDFDTTDNANQAINKEDDRESDSDLEEDSLMRSDGDEEEVVEEDLLALPDSVILRCVGLGYSSISRRM